MAEIAAFAVTVNKNIINNLSSVNNNLILVTNFLIHKELSDVGALISGQLKNLTEFGVHKNTTVAFESFL